MAVEDNFLTVSQLNNLIKNMLEGSFSSIQLKGEISNFKNNSSGHLYFALKDADSQISAVMFRGRASTLRFAPKDGMLVLVTGSVSVYPPQGRYQIIVTSMVQAGLGEIMEMIEKRKKKLAAEGLFDSSRKRILPFFPQTVGVVTSPTGAAIRDILRIAVRRNPKVSLTILPAMVQGQGASQTIE
ncbi:MAG: exodeoxyribonuclease VII large subunit, partial [Treponema sp.]|nr:exodeoxyribonuclease VII large subunit [Treponema sp.]